MRDLFKGKRQKREKKNTALTIFCVYTDDKFIQY